MSAHRGLIHSLAWSAESSVLVSGGADSTVRIWDAKSAGGERTASMRAEGNGTGRGVNGDAVAGMERGGLPMSPGGAQWDEMNST
jgi:transcription initiation factor TFIID subunit 5